MGLPMWNCLGQSLQGGAVIAWHVHVKQSDQGFGAFRDTRGFEQGLFFKRSKRAAGAERRNQQSPPAGPSGLADGDGIGQHREILIGALGGMVSSGFIGLFTGAVVLAVGYQIFMQWVAMRNAEEAEEEAQEAQEAAEATE